jgi:protein-tyrosine phosphatase
MLMEWISFRRNSKGWQRDPPAKLHTKIMFGPGMYLTPGFMKHHNITHVINCASNKDSPTWFREKYPSRYSCIEAIDSLDENILKWYPEFETTLNKFLREEESGNIYIHCQCGINRSGFLALLFVCKKFNYSFKLASDSILKQRPCALTNSTYKQQVIEYISNKNHITS